VRGPHTGPEMRLSSQGERVGRSSGHRLAGLDAARAVAMLGMLVEHTLQYPTIQAKGMLWSVYGRSAPLFVLLAAPVGGICLVGGPLLVTVLRRSGEIGAFGSGEDEGFSSLLDPLTLLRALLLEQYPARGPLESVLHAGALAITQPWRIRRELVVAPAPVPLDRSPGDQGGELRQLRQLRSLPALGPDAPVGPAVLAPEPLDGGLLVVGLEELPQAGRPDVRRIDLLGARLPFRLPSLLAVGEIAGDRPAGEGDDDGGDDDDRPPVGPPAGGRRLDRRVLHRRHPFDPRVRPHTRETLWRPGRHAGAGWSPRRCRTCSRGSAKCHEWPSRSRAS
jgi:hypothetical protein